MLLALGPLQLDPIVRTVVVGLVTTSASGCVEPVDGADAVWLHGAVTPDQVAEAWARSGLPVGATVDDGDVLDELVAAGAVAVEPAGALGATDVAGRTETTIWCTPAQAQEFLRSGVSPHRIVVEGGGVGDPGFAGVTVEGAGPAAWGAVVRGVLSGACVVRTTDARSARRVVTVTDRLVAARSATDGEVRA